MKREIVAVGILVVLFALSLLNIHFIDTSTEKLSEQVKRSGELADLGKNRESAELLVLSLEEWQNMGSYAHLVLRHEEIDPITDEYFSILDELESGGESTSASFETLISRLGRLAEMEHLTFESIF